MNAISDIKENLSYWWYRITKIPSNIREYREFLARWFSYYKPLRKAYDFDFASILDVERHQITRVRDAIIKYHNHLNWKRDVSRMNLALSLLNIIEENGAAELITEDVLQLQLEDISLGYTKKEWKCRVYVNTRNAYRFSKGLDKNLKLPNDSENIRELWKGDLYYEKAWKLYYKLREQYTRQWWD